MIEILAVLGLPLAGALVLAAIGERERAPEVNVAFSLLTVIAAAFLTGRVIAEGPMLVLDRQLFVDPFNVFLVALTAFVGFTTAIFSRPYMKIEQEHGKLLPAHLGGGAIVGGVWYSTSIVRRSPSAGAVTSGVKYMMNVVSGAGAS